MADLTDIQAAGSTKIIGSDATGLETTPMAVSANGDAGVADGISGPGLQAGLTATTANVAVQLMVGASPLSNRKSVTCQPISADFYWGYTNAVTTSSGTLIRKESFTAWACDPTATTPIQIWIVSATASATYRVTEAL